MAPDEAHFIPGAFCWVMHERLGSVCGATPDGRKAGFPFADGGGPAQGREADGPTTAILSTTSWDHAPLIGGVAYNMKFNSSLFDTPESVRRLENLLVTYRRRGGFEVQVNVVNPDTLRQAKVNPEEYRDLVVRIGVSYHLSDNEFTETPAVERWLSVIAGKTKVPARKN